tara:strand:+ start:2697 stop:8285 length:5589 start_codon:yes stop_codon:yes gene_type:complete
MAEFKISRLRYTWKSTWTTATAYTIDDVVEYSGSSYIALRGHTSTNFKADVDYIASGETINRPAWVKMADGRAFKNAWAGSTVYYPGDIVDDGGNLWIAVTGHTSTADFNTDVANWAIFVAGNDWGNVWTVATRYGVGDIINYGGIVYRCNTAHTSAATLALGLEDDQFNWTTYYYGVTYKGEYAEDTRYKAQDLVKRGGALLRVLTPHTTTSTFYSANFITEVPGSKVKGIWQNSQEYGVGDVVQHGGYVYTALTNSTSRIPGDSIYAQGGEIDWAVISKGYNLAGSWASATSYKTGDVVERGGSIYVATLDTTSDGSSLDYLDAGNWELIINGQAWKNAWTTAVTYAVGDVITYRGSAYKANVEHVASSENFPGDNGSGFTYWDLLLQGAENVGLVNPGDLLTFGLSRGLSGDTSTLGATNVPLGTKETLLQIGANDTLEYDNWGRSARYFHVDPIIGVDDRSNPNAGIDPFKPVKTIRYAVELCDDGFAGFNTIQLTTGVFKEILPLDLPPRTVVLGEELRSSRIEPRPAITEMANDAIYRIAASTHLQGVIRNILEGNNVTPTAGNDKTVTVITDQVPTGVFNPGPPTGDGLEIINSVTITSDSVAANLVDNGLASYIQYINFHIQSTGTDPVVSGTNAITDQQNRLNAARMLTANSDFLLAETIAYLGSTFSDYVLPTTIYNDDIPRIVQALAHDLKYEGNYKILREGKFYKSMINGSELVDMFYVRDATGVRQCSLKGLTGTLNPVNVFEQYQRPVGPNYVSLAPGWGTADESAWIKTRSPYIQGVSVFGTNCTGQKIDGSLHAGGNKSIVSNDFTQILSDGIGAHVLNNGRAELVSVFTYYNQVGYLAENGGIIRATNGNCSYGYIGALADGNDPTETPITAKINNRTENALVAAAFAGEVNDEILALEFRHAGQNYTNADYTFIGSGDSAKVIQEEFRDDSMYTARIVTGDASAAAGGGGFTLIGNNAQEGNELTVTIATSDDNEEANLLGLRIILTSGPGTGQYGYVHAYNSSTKVVTVYKESTQTAGWDHVVPGTPILTQLLTGTSYRFEPRVVFDAPPFSHAAATFDAGTTWADITYGETSATYTNLVSTGTGTGTVAGVVPANATFDITKLGKTYTVELRNGGAGFAVGDVVTILGSSIGAANENNITITVHSTTEDSTNSIVTFEYTGFGKSGRFVAVANTGSTINWSENGSTWNTANLPTTGSWSSIAAGNGKFVVVQTGSAIGSYSSNGDVWTNVTLPASTDWSDIVYGNPTFDNETSNIFVAIASAGNNAAFSSNGGASWTACNFPAAGDSTINEWTSVTYGKGQFVAIAKSNNLSAIGTWNGTTITWVTYIMDSVDDSSQLDWKQVAYGNNRYIAIADTGAVSYSLDGQNWLGTQMPLLDGSTLLQWNDIKYGQGVFMALYDTAGRAIAGDATAGPVEYVYTSPDGINWTARDLEAAGNWETCAFGNPDASTADGLDNRKGRWVVVNRDVTFNHKLVYTGATILGRAEVAAGSIGIVKIWEPGSGYDPVNTPVGYTVIDPNNTGELVLDMTRFGDGVLAQPSWVNRGNAYKTSTTTVTLTGDGFAEITPVGKFITVSEMPVVIGPGAQLRLNGNPELYTIVVIEQESQEGSDFTLRLRVSPELKIEDDPSTEHGNTVTINTRYSQCRISNHDFLDIGTGNFTNTNYPSLYTQNYISYPENEVQELNGGRVFYSSTDQTGNFRVGELFAVEQATGIVTISADFFDLAGLSELALGGIRVGGTGTVINEFSTDPLFIADSNNIIPTQRAIKAYLQNRLNVGGADLLTASFVAGTVRVGPAEISNTAGLAVNIPVMFDLSGPKAGIGGSYLAQAMFFKSFEDKGIRGG